MTVLSRRRYLPFTFAAFGPRERMFDQPSLRGGFGHRGSGGLYVPRKRRCFPVGGIFRSCFPLLVLANGCSTNHRFGLVSVTVGPGNGECLVIDGAFLRSRSPLWVLVNGHSIRTLCVFFFACTWFTWVHVASHFAVY
jgi:hypothetical protein